MRIVFAATFVVALTATAHAETVKLENSGLTLELPEGTTWISAPMKTLEMFAFGPTDAVGRTKDKFFFIAKSPNNCLIGQASLLAKGLKPTESSAATDEQKSHGWIVVDTPVVTLACADRDSMNESVTIVAPNEVVKDVESFRMLLDAVGTAHFGAAYTETRWLETFPIPQMEQAEEPKKPDPEPPTPDVPKTAGSEFMFVGHAGISTTKRTDPRVSRGSGVIVGYEMAMRGKGSVTYATDSGLALGYAYGGAVIDVRFGLGLAVGTKNAALMITGGAILSFLGQGGEPDGFTRHGGGYGTARVLVGTGRITASGAFTQTAGLDIDQRRYDATVGVERIFVTGRLIEHAEIGESVVARTVQLAVGMGGSF